MPLTAIRTSYNSSSPIAAQHQTFYNSLSYYSVNSNSAGPRASREHSVKAACTAYGQVNTVQRHLKPIGLGKGCFQTSWYWQEKRICCIKA